MSHPASLHFTELPNLTSSLSACLGNLHKQVTICTPDSTTKYKVCLFDLVIVNIVIDRIRNDSSVLTGGPKP